ncbi:hypothetical protein PABY_02310 [Pyrodictium abyssi]|uniref:Uncharacterized protein n=1 Tax=Pyrodictium abyssi TaxID=54256 RepID=A0ABN6ZK94_9CREN|nr:hypothetical protein PABY_02310 [Pyrodictium abyssi]
MGLAAVTGIVLALVIGFAAVLVGLAYSFSRGSDEAPTTITPSK